MTREERLADIARKLFEHKAREREYSEETKELREEFIRLHDDGIKGKAFRLPVKTIEIPGEFWDRTGMSMEDFIATRFPNWDVEHIERDISTGKTTFVLKQNYKYVSGVVDVNDTEDENKIIRVSKEVSEFTPEIDWDSLRRERSDLWERLADPKIVYEINEDEFDKLVENNPEELATLQRHMKVKPPTIRTTARRIKKDE